VGESCLLRDVSLVLSPSPPVLIVLEMGERSVNNSPPRYRS
jgi:hypothetical protein